MTSDSKPQNPTAKRQAYVGRGQAHTLLRVVEEVDEAVRNRYPADAALGRIFRQNRQFGAKDRRLYTNSVFSYFRWKGWVDSLSAHPAPAPCVYAALLDEQHVHPAITALAELGDIPPANLVPLGDKSIQEKAVALTQILNRARPPTHHDLIPDWAGPHLESGHDPVLSRRYIESFQVRPPTWLRVRPSEKDQVVGCLTELGYVVSLHPAFHEAVRVDSAISRDRLHAPEMPYIEVQDLASQCVGAICDPEPGQRWWDVCAGAGGKSLHLAERMRAQGSILATDIRSGALRELLLRSRRNKTNIITTLCLDEHHDISDDAIFDGVLVDAPCSGLGTWSRSPDARWRMPGDKIVALAKQQRDLLDCAACRVQSGGALVYAVCTMTACETIKLARDFEQAHPDFRPAPFEHPLTRAPAQGYTWIHPWDGPCGAMFVARWEKDET